MKKEKRGRGYRLRRSAEAPRRSRDTTQGAPSDASSIPLREGSW